MSLQYTIAYSIALFICFFSLGIFMLRNLYDDEIKFNDHEDDSEDGGFNIPINELPDIPLPPGISRPISDWEPEYNNKKTYV